MEDADAIIFLLKDVAKWLHENDVDQWGYLASGGEDEEIKEAIQKNETYMVKRDKDLIGTFTLYESQSPWDIHTWGKREDEAVYLHRLAVKRSEIGNGIGGELVAWIEKFLSEKGKRMLRLDCVESNEKLNQFYEKQGFIKQGVSDEHTLFEKRL